MALIAAYAFDEGTGTTAAEESGGTSITGVPAWAAGRHSNAMRLNLVDGPVIDPIPGPITAYTVMFDVYIDGNGSSGYNMFVRGNTGDIGTLQQPNTSDMEWYPLSGTITGATVPYATWKNLALVATGTTVRRVLIEGVEVWSGTSTSGISSLEPFNFGGGEPGYLPNIRLCNLRVFDSAETNAAIAALAGTPVGGAVDPGSVAAHWLQRPPGRISPAGRRNAWAGSAGGSVTVTGAADGTFGFTAAASGIPSTPGAASGSFGFVATASGIDRALGVAVAAFGYTGTAQGIDRALGQALATFGFTGTAQGVDRAVGVAIASFGFTATATGVPDVQGVAAASFGFTGTASGTVAGAAVTGVAAASFGFTATSSGKTTVFGAAVTSFGFAGSAAGVDRALGVAVATFGYTGTAAGIDRALGAATAALGFTATALGDGVTPAVTGVAVAAFGYSGTAVGRPRVFAVAVATFGFDGTVLGVNLSIVTSAERTIITRAELRVINTPAETRVINTPAESRTQEA